MDNDIKISLIKAARLACSANNSQPWQFDVFPSHIVLSLNSKRAADNDPYLRKSYISLGCALQNMIIQAKSYNHQLIYELKATPSPVMHISICITGEQKNNYFFIQEPFDKIAVNRGMYDSSYHLTEEHYINIQQLHHFNKVKVLTLREKKSQLEFSELIKTRANPHDKFKYFNTGSMFGCIAAKDPFDFHQLIQVGQLFVLLQFWALKHNLAMQPVGCYMIGIFDIYRQRYHETAHLISSIFQNPSNLTSVMGFRLGKPINIAKQGIRLSLNDIAKIHSVNSVQ